jgi:hypothetical protein
MSSQPKTKQLLKILIGAAWIDGVIQPEERTYLKQRAEALALAEDPDLKFLLSELKPVSATECYQWLEAYLGSHPQPEDYQELLETLSGLLYSDGDIQTQEAKLLSMLQDLEPQAESGKNPFDKILGHIQALYRRAIDQSS